MLALVFWNARPLRADYEQYRHALIEFHSELNQERPYGFRYSCTFRVESVPWFSPRCEVYEDWYVLRNYAAIDAMNHAVIDGTSASSHGYLMKNTAGASGAIYGLSAGVSQVQELAEAYWLLKPRNMSANDLAAKEQRMNGFKRSFWTRSLALGPQEHLLLSNRTVDLPEELEALHVQKELIWCP